MKNQSYNIKARVVYELKIKLKFDKVIKWFVLLLWSVGPFLMDQSCQSISFYTMLLLIKWPVLLAWAISEPFKGC